jgi:hypothetical protein
MALNILFPQASLFLSKQHVLEISTLSVIIMYSMRFFTFLLPSQKKPELLNINLSPPNPGRLSKDKFLRVIANWMLLLCSKFL